MKLAIAAVCDVGSVREHNEDMVLVGEKTLRDGSCTASRDLEANPVFLCAIADGIGGAEAGEVASEALLVSLREAISTLPEGLDAQAVKEALSGRVLEVHQDFLGQGRTRKDRAGMGTTLVGLLFYYGSVYRFHVGDSRLYRLRQGLLTQLTRDHSLRELLGQEDAPSHIILNSVGGGTTLFVDFDQAGGAVLDGDLFLLCSDGLSDLISLDLMEDLIHAAGGDHDPRSLENCAMALVQAAINQGGPDNISVVLVGVGPLR